MAAVGGLVVWLQLAEVVQKQSDAFWVQRWWRVRPRRFAFDPHRQPGACKRRALGL